MSEIACISFDDFAQYLSERYAILTQYFFNLFVSYAGLRPRDDHLDPLNQNGANFFAEAKKDVESFLRLFHSLVNQNHFLTLALL